MKKLVLTIFGVLWLAGVAFGATLVERSIAPSGGDHTSMDGFLDWVVATYGNDIVDNDIYIIATISGTWSSADNSIATVNIAQDATRYIRIQTDAANSFDGSYDASKYRLIVADAYSMVIDPDVAEGFQMYGVQIFTNYSSGKAVYFNGDGGNSDTSMVFENCFFGTTSTTTTVVDINQYYGDIYFKNCVFYSNGGHGAYSSSGDSNTYNYFYNCVAVNVSGSSNNFAFGKNAGSGVKMYATNCYAKAGGGASSAGFDSLTGVTTSASSDGSQSSATVAYSTDTFTNVTATTEDFHLAAGSNLIDAGTDMYGSGVTSDIDNDVLTVRDDIGIDEATAASPSRRRPPIVSIY